MGSAWRKSYIGTSASDWVRPVEDDWSPFPRAKHRRPEPVRAYAPAAPVAPPPPPIVSIDPKQPKPDFSVRTWDCGHWAERYFVFQQDTSGANRW